MEPTLTQGLEQAGEMLSEADRLGLDLDGVTDGLVSEGVRLFAESYDNLLRVIAEKRSLSRTVRRAS